MADRSVKESTPVRCPLCEAIKPAIFDQLDGRDATGTFGSPIDIVCAECKFIVATLYRDTATVQ